MNDYIIEWNETRSRFSLEKALKSDRRMIKKILRKRRLGKEEREAIMKIVKYSHYEFLETTKTSKSFEEFQKSFMGEEAYQNMIRHWLIQQHNEFFERVGMPDAIKPMATFVMESKDGEEENEEE